MYISLSKIFIRMKKDIITETRRIQEIMGVNIKKMISESIEINEPDLNDEQKSKIEYFISELEKKCAENNIELFLPNTPGVQYSGMETQTNGYFDSEGRVLACATGKELNKWLLILLHEASHMDQFLEKDPVFNVLLGLEETFKWIEGSEDVDFKLIDEEIKTSIDVEVDCEKRTVEKIKQYGLDFVASSEVYTQKSNAYALFYLWMRKKRSWYKIGFEPYNIESVYSKMPKTFDIDYTELSPDILDAFDHLQILSSQEQ
jgi:hypothetical protein